ncbi:TonB-dependent receptor domain-containing protein [Winogradskyella undariae]|uniref:TonB-dependent receptor domain-containing protein n=1 Tax=Winogradskyella undariae TaxID=1285465 RepID=UPI00211C6A99|nr:TonB-dependent receptor [Winogradskyella undariae]
MAFTQEYTLSGRVVDINNNPVEFANVVIITENEDGVLKGTSTDENGFFNLVNMSLSTFHIKISYIGYEEFQQKIVITSDLDLKTILLKESSENLGEVTVFAVKPTITRKPDRLIFNVENTALIEGSTLSVLKNTPGITVSDQGINIKSAKATVFINNLRVQLTSSELIQLLESTPANNIKSIEVITNPPASYDADSGSIINIIMSKNLVTGYRGSVQTNYTQGVFPRYNASTSHYFKNDKINLNLNYSYSDKKINRDQEYVVNYLDNSNNTEEIWESNINRNTWYQTHNLNLNFDYYINDKNTLSVTSTGLYMPYFKYKINNNTNITDENSMLASHFTSGNLSRDNKYNVGTDVTFVHDNENSSTLSFNLHYTAYDYDRDQKVLSNFYDNSNVFTGDAEFMTNANQNTDITTGKIDYRLPINESSNFETGFKYSNVKTDSDITRLDIIGNSEVLNVDNTDIFNYKENVFSGYANYSKTWNKWDINLGFRVEQTNIEGESLIMGERNTQDYLNWFPNTSLSYQLTDDVIIDANYKRSITRPSYKDLNPFTFFINDNTIVLGNPNLTPSFVDHFKIGVNFLDYFTVEWYYVDTDGAIEEFPRQDNDTNIIAYTPTNIDKTSETGLDLIFNYYPSNKWSVYAVSSTYYVEEQLNFGSDYAQQGQWSQIFILAPNLSLLKDNSLNVNLSMFYSTKNLQRFTTVKGQLFSTLSVSKSILKKKGTLSLSVEDLFNKQYTYTKTQYLDQSNTGFVNSDNRFIKLGFSYKFGNTKLNTNEHTTDAEERDRLKDLN